MVKKYFYLNLAFVSLMITSCGTSGITGSSDFISKYGETDPKTKTFLGRPVTSDLSQLIPGRVVVFFRGEAEIKITGYTITSTKLNEYDKNSLKLIFDKYKLSSSFSYLSVVQKMLGNRKITETPAASLAPPGLLATNDYTMTFEKRDNTSEIVSELKKLPFVINAYQEVMDNIQPAELVINDGTYDF